MHGSNGPGPKHDEAYDAFGRLYHDNSDIKSAYDICLPGTSEVTARVSSKQRTRQGSSVLSA